MKILIVSGFLGAGKTTFIKALAKHTGKKFAILENEYGAAGIDGERLNKSLANGEVNIWEMADGCICCSAKGDFAASVLTIANAVDPECLVVEPTGVGMLGRIVQNLQQIEYERISRKYNPRADIIVEHYSTLPREAWMRLLETRYDGSVISSADEFVQSLPDSYSLSNVSVDSMERLILLLEELIRGRYGNIIRAKGQLYAGKTAVQFDLVDGRYCITGMDEIITGKAVFIGDKIQKRWIRKYLVEKYKIRI